MFTKPRFRLVPDNTRIQFMRARFMGLLISAILSTASVVLFFYPGLNLGIDFSGGVVMEVRTNGPADFGQIHAALASEHIPEQGVQRFGDASEVTEASPTTGEAAEGNGEQLLNVGGYGPAPGASPASASTSA